MSILNHRLKPSLLALAISALLPSFIAHSATTSTTSNGGKTVTWQGDGSDHSAPIIERSGVKDTATPHELIVKNVTIAPSFTSSSSFLNDMAFNAAISLAGNNGVLGSTGSPVNGTGTWDYGDLILNVQDSSISGQVNGVNGSLAGLYARTDSANAGITINTNSQVDISITGVRVNGILAESLGVQGNATINLEDGANIRVANSSAASVLGSAAVNAQSGIGGRATITTKSNTIVSAVGNNIHGLYAVGKEILINNEGTITTLGDKSKGIHARGNGQGYIGVFSSGNITTNGIDASGIRADTSAEAMSGNIYVSMTSGTIDVSGDNSDGIHANAGDETAVTHAATSTANVHVDAAGNITTHGSAGAEGIFAGVQSAGGTGEIKVNYYGGNILTYGDDARGIYGRQLGSGQITMNNVLGNIETRGINSYGIYAYSALSGDVALFNGGKIVTKGQGAHGIKSTANTGNMLIANAGEISTSGAQSYGIVASLTKGDMVVINSGSITTTNADTAVTPTNRADGISVTVGEGDLNVNNSGTINSIGYGISTETTSGNVYITASNNITTGGTTAGFNGIYSQLIDSGTATLTYGNGTIKTNGSGMAIWDKASNSADVNGKINLNSGGIIDSTKGTDGLVLRFSGIGEMNIAQGAVVHGGSNSGLRLQSALATSKQIVNNWGTVDSINDQVIFNEGVAGSQVTINNYGTLTGSAKFGAGNVTINNKADGVWELRNFADTDGDGIRDTKRVAVIDFGAGSNVFHNEAGAILRLSAVSGALNNEPAGEWLHMGAYSSFNEGTVHGQLLNLDRFENRGIIDLATNGQAGNLLIITGSSMPGNDGGGIFVSDGGMLLLDTDLGTNQFGSLSDMLMVDNVILGPNGPTKVIIHRAGGNDELTKGNGIQIIEVRGSAEANSFVLGNVVKGGIYEYTLHQGEPDEGVSTFASGVQHWYLRNSATQLNPDLGTYLSNQTAATGLFIHSLHDRLGEPQFAERYNRDGSQPSMWVRTLTTNTKNEAGGGLIGQNTTGSLVHMGGDIAQWSSNGNNRYHMGLMAAYGKSETTSRSHTTGSRSKGKIDGYGAGAYFTWYSNESMPEGSYVDLWSMYNWFDNEVEGAAKYDSNAWISSLEIGHAVTAWQGERMQVMVEPHGQVAYTTYSADEHTDNNGLTATDEDADGFNTRLGARTYLRDSLNSKKAQPFIEANWLHSTAKNSLRFNGVVMTDNTPKDRLEVKVGVQGEITKNLQVYSHVGLQWGKDDYSRSEGMLGLKYRF